MLSILKSLRLYPPAVPYGGCRWMRGNYWAVIDKSLELALWADGSFTIVISEDEGDRELINRSVQLPIWRR